MHQLNLYKSDDIFIRDARPLGFRFPQIFPLLSTKRVLVRHAGKLRKAAYHKINHNADAYAYGAHCVSLNTAAIKDLRC